MCAIPSYPESAAANGVALRQVLWVRCRNVEASAKSSKLRERPLTRLDQALRATDLLLQAGGFAAIVLDLGATAHEHGNRIPAATWFRFRQAADRSHCSLVVLGKAAYAQSSAAVVLECLHQRAISAGEMVLLGFEYAVQRKRECKASVEIGSHKPPVSTWSVHAARQAEKHA